MRVRRLLSLSLICSVSVCIAGCGSTADYPVRAGMGPDPVLPEPDTSLFPTVNIAPAMGWPAGSKPQGPPGMEVVAFARDLQHPRWLYVLPNGDVLVAETAAPAKPEPKGFSIRRWMMKQVMEEAGSAVPSANRITLLRDTTGDGQADQRHVFLEGLNSPFGMVLVDDEFYVANTDALLRFPYSSGQTRIEAQGEKILDLPAGPINYHWTKNLVASPDGSKLYISVGSNSNIAERGLAEETGRAAIWELDRQSGNHRIFAQGLRNPVGMAVVPETGTLWTTVNERDELGSDLVPDYLTSVEDGGFYGWPFSYYGQYVDERVEPQNPELVRQALKPDYALGAHTASLGLVYTENDDSLQDFGRGMFVGQHGSWNRKPRSGYKVIFIPFQQGRPAGLPEEVLSGFVNEEGEAMGRPAGVALDQDGDLLVADDVGNTVWRVRGTDRPGMPISSSQIWRVADRGSVGNEDDREIGRGTPRIARGSR